MSLIPRALLKPALLLLIALAVALPVWRIRARITQLETALASADQATANLSGRLAAAERDIATRDGQIAALDQLNRQQAADAQALLQRLDSAARAATARATQLEAITHEDQDARRWGDTPLPAAVVRLLDTGAAPATAPAAGAGLRAGDGVPDAASPARHQPPTGADPAGHAPRP